MVAAINATEWGYIFPKSLGGLWSFSLEIFPSESLSIVLSLYLLSFDIIRHLKFFRKMLNLVFKMKIEKFIIICTHTLQNIFLKINTLHYNYIIQIQLI